MNILFVITGGIAEYKVIEAIRYQIKSGNQVKVAMTEMAKKFVTPLTFSTLTNQPVYDRFDIETTSPVAHIEIADWADKVVIAPATANFIGKMAQGIADDFASTVVLAATAPKFVIPAMNTNMWNNAAVQRNMQQLVNDGVKILEPDTGLLAEGYEGKGRYPNFDVVNNFIDDNQISWLGKKIVITAGPTQEPIDPVRFIGNHSSGKMGFALAKQAASRGAAVTLITGPTNLQINDSKIKRIDIITVDDLRNALEAEIKDADVLIMAAAVSDYRVKKISNSKLKKADFEGQMQLELVENPDVLASLKRPSSLSFVVGFAAETNDLEKNAANKLAKKHLDMIVANDVSKSDIGFNSDDNEVLIIQKQKEPFRINKNTKLEISNKILDVIESEMNWKA